MSRNRNQSITRNASRSLRQGFGTRITTSTMRRSIPLVIIVTVRIRRMVIRRLCRYNSGRRWSSERPVTLRCRIIRGDGGGWSLKGRRSTLSSWSSNETDLKERTLISPMTWLFAMMTGVRTMRSSSGKIGKVRRRARLNLQISRSRLFDHFFDPLVFTHLRFCWLGRRLEKGRKHDAIDPRSANALTWLSVSKGRGFCSKVVDGWSIACRRYLQGRLKKISSSFSALTRGHCHRWLELTVDSRLESTLPKHLESVEWWSHWCCTGSTRCSPCILEEAGKVVRWTKGEERRQTCVCAGITDEQFVIVSRLMRARASRFVHDQPFEVSKRTTRSFELHSVKISIGFVFIANNRQRRCRHVEWSDGWKKDGKRHEQNQKNGPLFNAVRCSSKEKRARRTKTKIAGREGIVRENRRKPRRRLARPRS